MDKQENIVNNFNHGFTIVERKNIIITGVKKICSFDNEEFVLDTTLGVLIIKGENLELLKLDTVAGNVSIKGYVNSLNYLDEEKNKSKESKFINKLFR